jgi:hypothetical protein
MKESHVRDSGILGNRKPQQREARQFQLQSLTEEDFVSFMNGRSRARVLFFLFSWRTFGVFFDARFWLQNVTISWKVYGDHHRNLLVWIDGQI